MYVYTGIYTSLILYLDEATFVYVNIFFRSFSKIDDVKMVSSTAAAVVTELFIPFIVYWSPTCESFLTE